MGNRVVVTGLGCTSPLGNDVPTSWEACINGKSGIDRITNFDPDLYRCQIAGEIKNFELPDIIPTKEVKKMDLFIQYSIAATQEALNDAKLVITEDIEEDVGVVNTVSKVLEIFENDCPALTFEETGRRRSTF